MRLPALKRFALLRLVVETIVDLCHLRSGRRVIEDTADHVARDADLRHHRGAGPTQVVHREIAGADILPQSNVSVVK